MENKSKDTQKTTSIYRDKERGFKVQKNAIQKIIRGCFKATFNGLMV